MTLVFHCNGAESYKPSPKERAFCAADLTLIARSKIIRSQSSVGLALYKGGHNAGRDFYGAVGDLSAGGTGSDTGKQCSVCRLPQSWFTRTNTERG